MKPGLTLYVVRHGETDWNVAGRLQGHTDIPLNDVGRGQAHKNGVKLRQALADPASLDFVASPLSRAYETMQLLRDGLGLPRVGFATDDRLKEISYGVCEGRTWPHLPPVDSAGVARSKDPFNWRPDGGESYADLMARTRHWLDGINRDTVVVTHGGITRTLRGIAVGIAPAKVPSLKVPQDRVLVLRDAAMSWL
jgi:broad specificity phosphatase PhoE